MASVASGGRVVAQRTRGRTAAWTAWIAGCVLLTLLLRLPWLHTALSIDEGGVALVARGWDDEGPFPYGHYWLDRPPALVLLYRLALMGGDVGIRVLGAVAAGLLVVLVAVLGRHLAGERAGRTAALIAGLLIGSAVLKAVFTTAEVLAVVPSCASVLCLVVAVRGHRRAHLLLAAAGLLAMTALLVKQSFGDALLAGAVALAVTAVHRPRAALSRAGAYAAGVAAPLLAMDLWEAITHIPDGAMWYAILGFRLDALTAIAGTHAGVFGRFERLLIPALASGLVVLVVWAARGLRTIARRDAATAALIAWLAGGLAGVLGGGSYWPHYLVQLIPVAAILAAVGLERTRPGLRVATVGAVALLTAGGAVTGLHLAPRYHAKDTAVATFVQAHARPGDTVEVLYARADVVEETGLASPFPYQWSLMLRTMPSARTRLADLLASPLRPTWLVQWQPLDAFGMNRDGAIRRTVRQGYRRYGTVAGHRVYLRRDVKRPLRRGTDRKEQPWTGSSS
jgi:hypothetical protein